MRSARASASSRSSVTSSTAAPRARASSKRACTSAIAPSSRPRTGWLATIKVGCVARPRPTISFCILPPESSRVFCSGPAQRMSNSEISACVCASAAPLRSQPRRLKRGSPRSSMMALCHSARSPTTPSRCRSSGMRARPAARSAVWRGVLSRWPRKSTAPLLGARRPQASSSSACWPLPATPTTPTISCACKARVALASKLRPALARTCASCSAHTTSPTGRGWRVGRITRRPTISSASSARVSCAAARCATSVPPRSTATWSATRSTSSSLWLIKITDRPAAAILRSVSNSVTDSPGVSTAVGSSSTKMRAWR